MYSRRKRVAAERSSVMTTELTVRNTSRTFASYHVHALCASLWAIAAWVSADPWAHAAITERARCANFASGTHSIRTELFMGLLTQDGATVSESEFSRFVDSEVTPRFPQGFTVVAGNGQFKTASGAIIREAARVLVLFYPSQDEQSEAKIEAIRASYKALYRQQSVLRVDGEACASF
jgi:Protein of unknown function (DUF3574)